MLVYLVIDAENSPGKVLVCFANAEDASAFLDNLATRAYVEERTAYQGQPPNSGFNR